MPTHSENAAEVQVNLPSGSTLLAITPILVVIVGIVVFSLVDLVRARSVRYLPKVIWGVIIVLVSTPLGRSPIWCSVVPGDRGLHRRRRQLQPRPTTIEHVERMAPQCRARFVPPRARRHRRR